MWLVAFACPVLGYLFGSFPAGYIAGRLAGVDVRALGSAVPPGRALDAFGGSGFFAGGLLAAGHEVTSVEGQPDAVREARLARERSSHRDRWRIEQAPVANFVRSDSRREEIIIVDPPRAGLGLPLARALAARARRRLIYVSCDPATLARLVMRCLPVTSTPAYYTRPAPFGRQPTYPSKHL